MGKTYQVPSRFAGSSGQPTRDVGKLHAYQNINTPTLTLRRRDGLAWVVFSLDPISYQTGTRAMESEEPGSTATTISLWLLLLRPPDVGEVKLCCINKIITELDPLFKGSLFALDRGGWGAVVVVWLHSIITVCKYGFVQSALLLRTHNDGHILIGSENVRIEHKMHD